MQAQSSSIPAANDQSGSPLPGGFGLCLVDENGKTVVIQGLPVTLGRLDENQIILKESTISAHHACIDYHQQLEAVFIEDLDSLNGLYIDGRATRKNVLQDGVKIRLGSVTLTFRDTGYIHPLT